jgi:hypothetical protein
MNNVLEIAQNKLILSVRLLCLTLAVLWISICPSANGQTISLQWNPESSPLVTGYLLLYGNVSQNYTYSVDAGTNTTVAIVPPALGTNYYFVVESYTADGVQSAPSDEVSVSVPPSLFLAGQSSLTNNFDFLQFPDGNIFGYYDLTYFPWIYQVDLGFEYLIDANDGQQGVYLYDNSSTSFWYTSPAIYPYVYDFTLNSWLYYYPDSNNPGHYTTNPRYFYNFSEQQVITR